MKWPTGRYNGQRIVGIEFKIVIDVTEWRWVVLNGMIDRICTAHRTPKGES